MHRRTWIGMGASALGVAVVIACSGKTEDVGDAGGGGMDAGLSGDCPASVPAQGAACPKMGIECEYGNDVDLACDSLASCTPSGWNVAPPRAGGCPTPAPAGACPATYASVPMGQTCDTATSCAYAEGTCSCEVYCGPQFPVGHPCEAGTPMTWQCTGAGQGCPAERPKIGSACAPDGQFCQYGDCDTTAEKCTDGTWHTQMTGCPISTSRYKRGIRYLDEQDRRALAERTLATPLATYEYTIGDEHGPRLGFVIEDQPPDSPAVVRGKDRVDLYGYTSMTVATLQVQAEQIAALQREVAALREDLANVTRVTPGCDERTRSRPGAP